MIRQLAANILKLNGIPSTYRCVWCGAIFDAISRPSKVIKTAPANADISADAISSLNRKNLKY